MITKNLAFLYDPLVNVIGVGVSLQKRVLKAVTLEPGETLLDVGCGTGTFVVLAKKTYSDAHITGVDPDESILKIAQNKSKKNNVDVVFVKAGGEKLPFTDRAFDYVVSTLVFHHLPTNMKKQALKEIYRVLKSDGKFLLTDIGKPKNLLWKILLSIESIVEPKEYLKDNVIGNIPTYMKNANFKVTQLNKPYLGIYFWEATK